MKIRWENNRGNMVSQWLKAITTAPTTYCNYSNILSDQKQKLFIKRGTHDYYLGLRCV
jgi:hypothetical protein